MKGFNFCIYENKVFDLNGHEISPDEDGVITIEMNGLERRFKKEKMIDWLQDSNYKSLFREPKKLPEIKVEKIKVAKLPKEKVVKIKKERFVKVKILKVKPPKIVKQKVIREKKPPKKYEKVLFDKRKLGNKYGFTKRQITCSNGKKYNSIYQASMDLNIRRASICKVCQGKWKHTHGLIFNYL